MAEFDTAASAAEKLENSGILGEVFPDLQQETVEPEKGTSSVESEAEQSTEAEQSDEVELQAEEVDEDEMVDQEQPQEADKDAEYVLDGPLTVDEFAESFGLDSPEKVLIKTNVSGEDGEINLQDILRSYQTEAAQTRKSQKFALEEKQRLEQWGQQQQVLNDQIVAVATMAKAMREKIEAQYNSEDMARLKTDDPGEYAVKQLEKTNILRDVDQQVANALAYNQQQQQQNKAMLEQIAQQTNQKIFGTGVNDKEALIPEWNDQETYLKESDAIRRNLIRLGYPTPSPEMFVDHRFIMLARDAMRYRSMLDKQGRAKEEVKKKVAKLPRAKVVRPGAKRTKAQVSAKQRQDRLRKVQKTGSVYDAADAISAVLPDDFFND